MLRFMKIRVIVIEKMGRRRRCGDVYSMNYSTTLAGNNFACNSF